MSMMINPYAFAAPGGGLWTPLNMATVPQIYLDAQDSVVTDVSGFASAISNLGSMGSAGAFSQAVSASRPSILAAELGGKRVLRFDGADDLLGCSTTTALAIFRNASAAWVFSVYKKRALDGSPTGRYLFFSPRNDTGGRFGVLCADLVAGRANKPYLFARRLDADASPALNSPSIVQGAYFITAASVDFSTRAAFIRENGIEVASNATLTASAGATSDTQSTTSALTIAAYPTGSFPADIDLAAMVISNVQPAADEFEKLEGWAAHKYGLTANLPGGHPYKTVAPTV
jgi:hypothetical protein